MFCCFLGKIIFFIFQFKDLNYNHFIVNKTSLEKLMNITAEQFLNFELFEQEFNNFKNGVKKSFNREELLSVQLLGYLRALHSSADMQKVVCDFDTKAYVISKWNEMVEGLNSIESAPVLSTIFSPILSECFEENKTAIAAFEQFLSIVNSGNVDFNMAFFEYSNDSKGFVGFCLKSWVPDLMTYDFEIDIYKTVSFSLISA